MAQDVRSQGGDPSIFQKQANNFCAKSGICSAKAEAPQMRPMLKPAPARDGDAKTLPLPPRRYMQLA